MSNTRSIAENPGAFAEAPLHSASLDSGVKNTAAGLKIADLLKTILRPATTAIA